MELNSHSTKNRSNCADGSDALRCDLCGIPYIHKNDYGNHLRSRGHKIRLRQKEREDSKGQEQEIKCEVCDRILRGADYYKAHLGSKTHKRNLKKYRGGRTTQERPARSRPINTQSAQSYNFTYIHEAVSISEPPPIDDGFNCDFVTKEYIKSDISIENLKYKTYIYSLTAYLTLQLAFDPTIEDFMISVNEKEWNVFGNVVVHIAYKDRKVTYAIQCKRVTQSFKHISDLQELEVYLGEQYNHIAQLRQKGKVITKTKFVIATTWGTVSNFSHSTTLKPTALIEWMSGGGGEDILSGGTINIKSCSKKKQILNVTGDPENVYNFVLSNKSNFCLPRLFLYTEQKVLPSSINELLKQRFDKAPDISSEYIKYIENWVEGRLGGNYRLNKKDVVLKIGELLLRPYMIPPKKIDSKQNSFTLWNQVIDKVDLTVVKNEAFIISKICEPLNIIIERTLSTTIDTIAKTVTLKKRDLRVIEEPIKSYFLNMTQKQLSGDIPLYLIYNIFWKAGQIPLLLSVEDQDATEFILDVISFMKQKGVHKKFLIRSDDLNLTHLKGNLKVFTNLDDVKDLVDWNKVEIRVNENFKLPLDTIQSLDPFFFKWVTPNIFFDIALSKYSLKPSYFLNKNFIGKDVLRVILSDEVKDELQNELYPEATLRETDAEIFTQSRLRGVEPGIL